MTGIRRVRRSCAIIPALALLALWLVGSPMAASAQSEKLVVGVGGVSGALGGILVARDHGLFREQGLDVEFVFISGGTYAVQALLRGDLALVAGLAGPAVVNAVLAGGEIVWIGELLGTMPHALVAAPEITRVADLRGKRVGVAQFGGSNDFATRFMLTRSGLDPTRDVTLVQIGEESVRLAAVAAGSIAATTIGPSGRLAARKLGFRELADALRLGLRYPHEGLVVSRAFLKAQPETLRRFVKAVVVGTHRYRTSRTEGIEALRKYLKIAAEEALAGIYEVYGRLILAKPYVPLDGIQLVLDELAATNPRARTAKPEEFVDMRFVRELDESGFIDRLYAR